MYDILAVTEMAFNLALFVLAWMAGRQAVRLRKSGTAERLHRKSRKLIVRTVWLTLPALIVFYCIGWFMSTMPSIYWEDRILLNAPLIGAPLLAVWFTTVPMLLQLRKTTLRSGGPLHPGLRGQLRSRLFVLPYQATALGAGTSFYTALVSPVPYDPVRVAAPILAYIGVMIGLWMHHDGRFVLARNWLRSRRERDMQREHVRR